jgi:hypothetical protein
MNALHITTVIWLAEHSADPKTRATAAIELTRRSCKCGSVAHTACSR